MIHDHEGFLRTLAVGVVLGLIGLLLTRGWERDPLAAAYFEAYEQLDEAYDDLEPVVVEVDAASGLPIVPSIYDEPYWSDDRPTTVVAPRARYRSDGAVVPPHGRREVATLIATFADHDTALEVARSLADAVGDPVTEREWLREHDAVGKSFEWAGARGATAPFVQAVGPHLLVAGLVAGEEQLDPGTGALLSPLVGALRAMGAAVLVEGDRWGEGAVTMDLACSGARADLEPTMQDLADHQIPAGSLQPPWLPPGITEQQRRARRTERLLDTLSRGLLTQQLGEAELREHLDDELERFGDGVDREVVEWFVADTLQRREAMEDPTTTLSADELAEVRAENRRRSEHLGSNGLGADQLGTFYGPPAWDGADLAVAFATWSGVAEGLVSLLAWLHAGGCDEIRVDFVDFDDVRGD